MSSLQWGEGRHRKGVWARSRTRHPGLGHRLSHCTGTRREPTLWTRRPRSSGQSGLVSQKRVCRAMRSPGGETCPLDPRGRRSGGAGGAGPVACDQERPPTSGFLLPGLTSPCRPWSGPGGNASSSHTTTPPSQRQGRAQGGSDWEVLSPCVVCPPGAGSAVQTQALCSLWPSTFSES